MKKKESGRKHFAAAEFLIVILLFCITAVIRFSYIREYIPEIYGKTGFLEIALVTEGKSIPYMANGISLLYTWLLHLVFWLFGNKAIAGIYLQAVLQVAALFCLYIAIRKISNMITAAATVLGAMALPSFLWTMGEMIPGNLLFLLVCFYLMLAAGMHKSIEDGRYHKTIWLLLYVLLGIGNAALVLADSMGLLLLPATLLLFFSVKLPEPASIIQKRWFGNAGYLTGFAGGILLLAGMKAFWEGSGPAEPYIEYLNTYFTEQNYNLFTRWGFPSLLCSMIILLCVLISFMKRLAFRKVKLPEKKKSAQELDMVDIDSVPDHEFTPQGIKYIENPLPVPKRHVKKEMTYAFEPPKELMHFDVEELDQKDDFDLA